MIGERRRETKGKEKQDVRGEKWDKIRVCSSKSTDFFSTFNRKLLDITGEFIDRKWDFNDSKMYLEKTKFWILDHLRTEWSGWLSV